MISEGSYDTENWINDCFAITGINYSLKCIQIENILLILQYLKILLPRNFWTVMYV